MGFNRAFWRCTNLNDLRWPKTAHPHEATLGRRLPHAGDEVEDVGFRDHGLQVDDLIVVCQAVVDEEPELVLRQMVMQGIPELHC